MNPDELSMEITRSKRLVEAHLLKGDIISAAKCYELLAKLYHLSRDPERSKESYIDAMSLYADIHKYSNAQNIARILKDPLVEIYAELSVIASQEN